MRERLEQFMRGRYGVDQFGQFLNILLITLILISCFFYSRIFQVIIILLLIFSYRRIFSRNFSRCSAQNQWFLKKTYPIRNMFYKQKAYGEIRKNYHIYICKNCKQKIKIPKGKGKIIITCPKCGYQFHKKS